MLWAYIYILIYPLPVAMPLPKIHEIIFKLLDIKSASFYLTKRVDLGIHKPINRICSVPFLAIVDPRLDHTMNPHLPFLPIFHLP